MPAVSLTIKDSRGLKIAPCSAISTVEVRPKIENHLNLAKHVAIRFIKSNQNVEDSDEYSIALEALWKATEKWQPDMGCKFSHYACVLMRNALLNKKKSDARSLETEPLVDVSDSTSHSFDDLAFYIQDSNSDSETHAKDKEILRKKYLNEMTWKEVARFFGVSAQMARKRANRALQVIRRKHGILV
jgi:RNA polymerase sigma factor (sigma-70 family)